MACAGLVFVGLRLVRAGREVRLDAVESGAWLGLALLAVLYAAGGTLLSLAWREVLRAQDVMTTTAWAIRVYGLSQLGKYVPGNVFQFAGRQALGLVAGHPGWKLASSSLHELLLLAAGGVSVSILGAPLFLPSLTPPAALALFLALTALMTLAAWRLRGRSFARALIGYTLFLLLSGGLFVTTVSLIAPNLQLSGLSLLPLCGGFVLAWLAGFMTPGSPAGLGVRETVSLLLFQTVLPERELLLSMALARAVTTIGDVLFFLGAWALANPSHRPEGEVS